MFDNLYEIEDPNEIITKDLIYRQYIDGCYKLHITFY